MQAICTVVRWPEGRVPSITVTIREAFGKKYIYRMDTFYGSFTTEEMRQIGEAFVAAVEVRTNEQIELISFSVMEGDY